MPWDWWQKVDQSIATEGFLKALVVETCRDLQGWCFETAWNHPYMIPHVQNSEYSRTAGTPPWLDFGNTISSRSKTTMIRLDSRSIVPFISPRYKAHHKETDEAKHHEGAGQRQNLCQVNQFRLSSKRKLLLFKWENFQILLCRGIGRKGVWQQLRDPNRNNTANGDKIIHNQKMSKASVSVSGAEWRLPTYINEGSGAAW